MEEETLGVEEIRAFIDSITQQFGFEEISKTKDTFNEFEAVQITTTTKGVFKGRDGYLGIICNFVKPKNLNRNFQRIFKNQFPVESIYEGENYLLCLSNSKIYSFNIDYFNELNSVIDEIDYEYPLTDRKITIGIDKENDFHILCLQAC